MKRLFQSLRARRQRTVLVLLVGAVLTLSPALTRTAFSYQEQEKPSAKQFEDVEARLSQTAFIYQGQLKEGSVPASGTYDLQFILYTAQTEGYELGAIVYEDMILTNGLFSVMLDFGGVAIDGQESWLEVAVRPGESTDLYTVLSPRQKLTPTPYAIFAQQERWSLIGVPVGFTGGVGVIKDIDALKEDETPAEESTAAAPQGDDGDWERNGDILSPANPNGRDVVTIGTDTPASPSAQLTVASRSGLGTTYFTGDVIRSRSFGSVQMVLEADTNNSLEGNQPSLTFSQDGGAVVGRLGYFDSNNKLTLKNEFNDDLQFGTNDTIRMTIRGNGNLEVRGQTTIKSDDTFPFVVQRANGDNLLFIRGNTGTLDVKALEVSGRTTIKSDDTFPFVVERANGDNLLFIRGNTGTLVVDVLEINGGGDLAEPFEVSGSEAIKPGMVVAIDPAQPGRLRIADKAYDRTVAGIVSGANGINPGLTMKQEGTVADGSLPVSLTGRVYCWADASYGPIEPGDLLTTSNTPGHAMKVTDHAQAQGTILGKAMTGLKHGQGLVLVLVTLQ